MTHARGDNWPRQDRRAGLGRQRRPGGKMVTVYDPSMALEIVEKVANGELLKDICAPDSHYCHITTFRKWRIAHPELERAYSAARQISAEALEEEALSGARGIRD